MSTIDKSLLAKSPRSQNEINENSKSSDERYNEFMYKLYVHKTGRNYFDLNYRGASENKGSSCALNCLSFLLLIAFCGIGFL